MFGLESIGQGLFTFGAQDQQHDYDKDTMDKEWQYQMAMANHGIRWKVADAKKAGLHPLAALGAQTMSYAPSRVGGSSNVGAWGDLGKTMGKEAEDTINYFLQEKDRKANDAFQKNMRSLELRKQKAQADGAEIDNMLKQRHIDQLDQNNPMPMVKDRSKSFLPGQDTAVNKVLPQIVVHDKQGIQRGAHPAKKTYIDSMKRAHMVPADSEAFSDENVFAQLKYHGFQASDWLSIMRNPTSRQSMKMIQAKRPKAPKGLQYQYEMSTNTYYLVDPKVDGHGMFYYDPKQRQTLNKAGVRVKRYPYWVTPMKKLR